MVLKIFIAVVFVALCGLALEILNEAGRSPRGRRAERVKSSPHYIDGEFRNEEMTTIMPDGRGFSSMFKAMRQKVADLVPAESIPVVKTDIGAIPRSEDVVIWLGHSSLYVQSGGIRYLFDPVLTRKSISSLALKPFKGSNVYSPEDIPEIDYLIITHDHWDHLDKPTVCAIRGRVGQVVCSLGVGQYLEDWGYPVTNIHDLDWGESIVVNDSTVLRCLPARHFSGRLFRRNQTFWGSYLIDGPRRIYVSGDGGYDGRFEKIGEDFPGIDLAVMENGQYNEAWKDIHTIPSLLPKAIDELAPCRVMTYHNSKFALARHGWKEPLEEILKNSEGKS